MSIFDFMSEGIEETSAAMLEQISKLADMMAQLRNVIDPLEDGGWIGQGAEAFFAESVQLLSDLETTRGMMDAFNNSTNQTLQMTLDAIQRIDQITNG